MKKDYGIVHCRVSRELFEQVKAYSDKTGISITTLVTQSLSDYLRQRAMMDEIMSNAINNPEYFLKLKSVVDRMESVADIVSSPDQTDD